MRGGGTEGVWLARINEANAPLEPGAAAVEGVDPGQWVVTVGHELLSRNDTGKAVIQPTPWEHIMRLQQMQTRDLLDLIRLKQEEAVEPL